MNNQDRRRLLPTMELIITGPSLIDILHQHESRRASQCGLTTTSLSENSGTAFQQGKMPEISDHEKSSSSLFHLTGRERNATELLKKWLYKNQAHPYPTEDEKQELMAKTNMSPAQITTWFTNARVRLRKEQKLESKILAKGSLRKSELKSKDLEAPSGSSDPSSEAPIVIGFSSLQIHEINELEHLRAMFPQRISISRVVEDSTTHLIVGGETKPLFCPATTKVYQAICRHLYVLTYKWVVDCIKQCRIIDETYYEVRGDTATAEYHDGMRKSRLSKAKLFENCKFFILCDDCQGSMTKVELADLIKLCHGSILDSFPLMATTGDTSSLVVVLCNKLDRFDSMVQKQLYEQSRSNGVHFLNPEWVLESIVQFVLQSCRNYEEQF